MQSGYFLSIFIIQIFNMFACKITRLTISNGTRFLSNKQSWKLVALGIVLAAIVVYTPVTNAMFLTSMKLNPIYLLIPLAFGVFLYGYSIVRRLILQKCTKNY